MTRTWTHHLRLVLAAGLTAALLPLVALGGSSPAAAAPAQAPCFGGVAGLPADPSNCDTSLGLHTISGRAGVLWGGEVTIDSGFAPTGTQSVTWRFAFESGGMTIVSGCTSTSVSCKVRWKPASTYTQAFQVDATLRQGLAVVGPYKAVEVYAPPPLRYATVLPKSIGGSTVPATGDAYAVRGGTPAYTDCVDPLTFESAGTTDAQCVILKPGGNLGFGDGWSAYLPTSTSWTVYAGRHGLSSSPVTDSWAYPPVGLAVPADDPVTVPVTALPRAPVTLTTAPSPLVVGLGQSIPVSLKASLPAGTGGAFRLANWIDVLVTQPGSTGAISVVKPSDLSFDLGPGRTVTLPVTMTGTTLGTGTVRISARASVGSVTGTTETATITVPFTVQKDPVVVVDPPPVPGNAPKPPVVTRAVGPRTTAGTVSGPAATQVTVRLFVAPSCPVATNPSTPAGSVVVTTDKAGKAAWSLAASTTLPYGQVVFATAQVGADVSARSACAIVKRPAAVSITAPKKAKHGKAVYATVKVTAPGAVPTGKVTVSVGAKKRTATLVRGSVRVKLPGTSAKGRKTIVVTYAGSTTVAPARATKKIRLT